MKRQSDTLPLVTTKTLSGDEFVMVSAAVINRPEFNREHITGLTRLKETAEKENDCSWPILACHEGQETTQYADGRVIR
jgi:hypothetical protein